MFYYFIPIKKKKRYLCIIIVNYLLFSSIFFFKLSNFSEIFVSVNTIPPSARGGDDNQIL